jgi:hypothetical protein
VSHERPYAARITYEKTGSFTDDGQETTRDIASVERHDLHGNEYQALQVVQSVVMDLEVAVATSSDGTARKLLKAVEEFHTYIENNAGFMPNYGERYHHGERISTGFVESTVPQVMSKRMVNKPQMWAKRGAHSRCRFAHAC